MTTRIRWAICIGSGCPSATPCPPALDDMKQYAQITQADADGTKRLVDAFEPLYTSLSPEQKKLADTAFRQGGPGKGRHGHAPRKPHASGADAASAAKP
nr:hypothetical protein [Candidatus Burkholderia verschuerenii]